jgi:two-component system, sensor histidine kinase and response regulator
MSEERASGLGSPVGVPGRILLVDDDARIREVLRQQLAEGGHVVIETGNGLSALAVLGRESVDLVLLDIEMPGLTGREVLARMKADPSMRKTPVIVVTGVEDLQIAEECLQAGAEDYVQKPFQWLLLRARIRACLDRRAHEKREEDYLRLVERYNLDLEAAVHARTRELEEAHKRLGDLDRAKDDFLTLIGHELRTPVTGLAASGQIMAAGGLSDADRNEMAGVFTSSLDRLTRIVEDALLLARLRVGRDVPVAGPHALDPVLANAVAAVERFARSRDVAVDPAPLSSLQVRCEPDLLRAAVAALIECVVKFCPPAGRVSLRVESEDGSARVYVRSSGGTVPPEVRERLFGVFSVVESLTPGGDLGLGPPLAARILGLFGGDVAVESTEGEGVSLVVTLQDVL